MNKNFYALLCLIVGFSFFASNKSIACSLNYVTDNATQIGFSSISPSNNSYFHVGPGFAPLPASLGSVGVSDLKISYVSAFT
ncbi:MAG: hypothetical protein HC817_11475, partial [Saprospiraceae bacterium]|nr:hypothetical protein [Saprospiraceae bacterium]